MSQCYLCDKPADFVCVECGISVCKNDSVMKDGKILCYNCFSRR